MKLLWAAVAGGLAFAVGCGGSRVPEAPLVPETPADDGGVGPVDSGTPGQDGGRDSGTPPSDAGVDGGSDPDGGFDFDGGLPDSGMPDVDSGIPETDSGTPDMDAGMPDAGPPIPPVPPGPWPVTPVINFTTQYGVGTPQSFSVDDAQNVWLLNADQVGVLRGTDTAPHWATGLGQAKPGFGANKLALYSTIICGGAANTAYVGYAAEELTADPNAGPYAGASFIFSPDGLVYPEYTTGSTKNFDATRYQEYQRGDADVVTFDGAGTPTLVEHLNQSVRIPGQGGPVVDGGLGLHNSNDFHFMEDRTILSCTRVTRGAQKGVVYLGTNHGVTRVEGQRYNSHRHAVWIDSSGSQHIGENHGLGISPAGDVLMANEWMFGVYAPNPTLENWDIVDDALTPQKVAAYLPQLNDLATFDHWRAFQQTPTGAYYLASSQYGLWQMSIIDNKTASGAKVAGLPTDVLTSLAATDDGSVFIGTDGFGTWRITPAGTVEPVATLVPGSHVISMFYEPAVSPAMLFVLTDQGLVALRGF